MKKLRVAFLHPTMRIGGAEQLVVNLALALIRQGHQATIYTPEHLKDSFPETLDGTIPVIQCGTFFGIVPKSIFNRFQAALAMIRMFLCTMWMLCYGPSYDIVVCDIVTLPLPLLKMFGCKTVYYCHFPQKLLAKEGGFLKKLYRLPVDIYEQVCMCFADIIYVNSRFTQSMVKKHFKLLGVLNRRTQVLYPALDFSKFDTEKQQSLLDRPYFLSLNRYERKKNIKLAVEAYSRLPKEHTDSTYLVIAGGFDENLFDSKECLRELQELTEKHNVSQSVKFMKNVSDKDRTNLLKNSIAVLYTPDNEHFGIVPCQAMYCQVPVIAPNNGGPMESVANGETGFLLDKPQMWTNKMQYVLDNKEKRLQMGRQGKKSMQQRFGMKPFSQQFIQGLFLLLS